MAGLMFSVPVVVEEMDKSSVTTNCCNDPVDWRVCGFTAYTVAMVKTSPFLNVGEPLVKLIAKVDCPWVDTVVATMGAVADEPVVWLAMWWLWVLRANVPVVVVVVDVVALGAPCQRPCGCGC